MMEQWNISWWNRRTFDGRTVEHRCGTVKQWNRQCATVGHLMVEQWNILWWNSGKSDGGTVEHLMVEQWNI